MGQHLGREQVGHDYHIKMVMLEKLPHGAKHGLVHRIHRGVDRQLPVAVSQLVEKAEKMGSLLGGFDIAVSHQLVKALPCQGVGVQHGDLMTPPLQLLFHRGTCGIVTAAGAAGQNQCVHRSFTSTEVFSSRLVNIRRPIPRQIREKPVMIAVLWAKSSRAASVQT